MVGIVNFMIYLLKKTNYCDQTFNLTLNSK